MNIIEVNERTQDLIQQLLMVWEKSVRETHLFLLDAEIENIKQYVPEALSGVAHLIIANIVAMEDEIIVGLEILINLVILTDCMFIRITREMELRLLFVKNWSNRLRIIKSLRTPQLLQNHFLNKEDIVLLRNKK